MLELFPVEGMYFVLYDLRGQKEDPQAEVPSTGWTKTAVSGDGVSGPHGNSVLERCTSFS